MMSNQELEDKINELEAKVKNLNIIAGHKTFTNKNFNSTDLLNTTASIYVTGGTNANQPVKSSSFSRWIVTTSGNNTSYGDVIYQEAVNDSAVYSRIGWWDGTECKYNSWRQIPTQSLT